VPVITAIAVQEFLAAPWAVMGPLGNPAQLAGRGLQGIACGRNMAALGGGEEVEVFGRPCREVLCEQGCSPGQQEAVAGGQREEQPGHLQLEGRQPGVWVGSSGLRPEANTDRCQPSCTTPNAASMTPRLG
jgi:hypothetical protein